MFTGIVQEIGTVERLERRDGVLQVRLHAPRTATGLARGESVAINGVCVSVVRNGHGSLSVELIPETQRLTNLRTLAVGSHVNVERSLTLSDRLNGHVVLGHVDGTGRVTTRQARAGQVSLEVEVDRQLRRFLVPKGPVTIDGVSLTVGQRLSPRRFWVHLIPDTLQHTTLGARQRGELVNIEIDYVAKLIAHWTTRRS